MKSILQDKKVCLICGSPYVEEHHILPGTANRRKCEAMGLKCYLCHEHHQGKTGAHQNKALRLRLERMAQEKFESTHTHEEWMNIFHKNYIGGDEIGKKEKL